MAGDVNMVQRPGILARAMLVLIRVYQFVLSPLTGGACRFLPTCSDYSSEAIRRHGAWRGLCLGGSRLLRCAPWGGHGFDPVPTELPDHGWRIWRYCRWTPPGDAGQASGNSD